MEWREFFVTSEYSMNSGERNVKSASGSSLPAQAAKNVACLKKRIGRSCSANAAANDRNKKGIKKHITLIARKIENTFNNGWLQYSCLRLLRRVVHTGAEFKKAFIVEYETTEAQRGWRDRKTVSSEDILKKLDEIIGNPRLSGMIKVWRRPSWNGNVTVETVEEFLDSIGPHKVNKTESRNIPIGGLPAVNKGNLIRTHPRRKARKPIRSRRS